VSELTELQRRILYFLAPAEGEGLVLAHDIAVELGVSPRGMGQRLEGLRRRGYLRRHLVKEARLHGWEITDLGWKMVRNV
jgi:DNA-binding IscR family transcriptional regulator